MKYIILIILFSLYFFNSFAQFIEDEDEAIKNINDYRPANVLKTNPLAIISSPMPYASEYRLIMEHQINKKTTFFIGASYLSKGPILSAEENTNNSQYPNNKFYYALYGYRVQGGYKFYYNGKSPKGFYVGPFISYLSSHIKEKGAPISSEYIKITYFNVNLVFGHQFIIGDVFSIDICSGWGYKNNEYFYYTQQNNPPQDLRDDWSSGLQNVKFVFNFNFGYKF
ncbi:MAG: hypothetical protein DRI94_15065 [Bacteroidetes bacterium]|nr:MAG: hypothetical protein DRI94_15065 [Bacteroidota bacterium]